MKKIIGSLTLILFVAHASADVFIAPSNEVVFLTVPANQTMLISSVKLGDFGNGNSALVSGLVVQNGVTNQIAFLTFQQGNNVSSGGPFALNGPCQIAFVDGPYGDTNGGTFYLSLPVVVSYNLLQNSLLHSVIATPGSSNVISVPAGKSLRFLSLTYACDGGSPSRGFTFQNGTSTVYSVQINSGDEFTGPLTITKTSPDWCYESQLISYYFTDDFFVVPETGYLQGPTGSFEIAVEKSVDLMAWCPVVVYNTGSDQKAFYRLRMQK